MPTPAQGGERREVGSKDNNILGAYGRDTLNDNGQLLLSFANNHDLAIVNTFFSTSKGGVSHTFNGRGKKRIDYIRTRQHGRKLVRNVTVHPQPSFLPISDHNIVSTPVKLLGYFARNRRLRVSAKPPGDRSPTSTGGGHNSWKAPQGKPAWRQQYGRRRSRIHLSHHADR